MREILFRGKSDIGNMWVEGYYTRRDNDGDIEHRIETIIRASFRMIPETLGQWTGLKDKDGTGIFEGDIIKGSWNTRLVIYFDSCCLQFRAREIGSTITHSIDYYRGHNGYEIIGNIYDNPELLEGDVKIQQGK